MINELVQTNFTSLTILVFFYIFLYTGSTLSKHNLSKFRTMIFIVFFLIAGDFVEYITREFDHPVFIRSIAAAFGYTLRPLNVYALFSLAMNSKNRSVSIMGIPLIFNGLLAFLSIGNGLYFSYTPDNQYLKGPLWFIPFVISGYYLLHIIVLAAKKYLSYERGEAFVLLLALSVTCLTVYMEAFMNPPYMCLLNGAGATALVFYYLFLHTRTYNHDAMTGMLNRHSFYADSPRLAENCMIIVSVDLNNLKKINDTQGHDAGDNAISFTAATLFRVLPKSYRIYRMGGDEFTVLCPKADLSYVEKRFSIITLEMKKEGYDVSWGAVEYAPESDLENCLKASDEKMYEMKKRMKGADIR